MQIRGEKERERGGGEEEEGVIQLGLYF